MNRWLVQSHPPTLKDLSPDIWRDLGERVGLAPLLRLWLCGNKELALSIQRVYYRRLHLSFHHLLWSQCADMEELARKLSICLQFQADEITLFHAAPELLYMAAHIVSPRQSRTSLSNLYAFQGHRLDREQLEAVPWLRFWESTYKLVLMRAQSFTTGICLGDFATPKSICLHRHRSVLGKLQDTLDGEFDFRFQLPLPLPGLQDVRFNTAFISYTALLDLNSLPPTVRTCSVTFSVESRRTTRLQVSNSATLSKLIIRNLKSEFTVHNRYYPVTVVTDRLDKLKTLSATGVLWANFVQTHAPEIASNLTHLSLSHCSLGYNAWALVWPSHLLSLSIIECTTGPAFYRLLDPLKLPLYLESLTIKGGSFLDMPSPQQSDIQFLNAAGLDLAPAARPPDFVPSNDVVTAPIDLIPWRMSTMLFSAETMRHDPLPNVFLRRIIIDPSMISPCALEYLPTGLTIADPSSCCETVHAEAIGEQIILKTEALRA